jgi:hypothetical protein
LRQTGVIPFGKPSVTTVSATAGDLVNNVIAGKHRKHRPQGDSSRHITPAAAQPQRSGPARAIGAAQPQRPDKEPAGLALLRKVIEDGTVSAYGLGCTAAYR